VKPSGRLCNDTTGLKHVLQHVFENFLSKIWREFPFCRTFAALTINDVCHRRLSVGYPLESASGYFYAR